MRLRAAGQRPISNVVDVSNYVMLELGKPIHTYDADGVARDATAGTGSIVRRAEPAERLETIDHVARPLDADTLLIADERGPLGIAGIMGGAASEVSDATTRVIVESAIFDPILIRRTGQRYALRSEASLRFEKGQETRLARIGADRAARLVAEWAGGSVARGRVDSAPAEPGPTRVPFRPARVSRLLGVALAAGEQRELLARVGVETEPATAEPADRIVPVAAGGEPLAVEADPADVRRRDRPDLAARHRHRGRRDRGGRARPRLRDRSPAILPDTPMPAFRASPLAVRDRIRETIAGAGLTEVVTHALVVAGAGRAVRLVRGDGAGRRRDAGRRPDDHGHEPAVDGPFGAPPVGRGQPRRDRGGEPAARAGRRRDLRDRQGLRRRRRRDPRVVAARVRPHGRGRGAGLEPAGRRVRPRRREGRDRARLPPPRLRRRRPGRRSPTSRCSIRAAPPG